MSTNFELLDQNILTILETLGENQTLCKYLYYDTKQPTLEADITDTSTLLLDKLWPTPFDEQVVTTDGSQLRVFYFLGNLSNNMVVSELNVTFDIIVAKRLWLIQDENGKPQIRPYRIMNEITKQFRNKSVDTVGKMLFKNFHYVAVNKDYDAMRLTAQITGFSGGE